MTEEETTTYAYLNGQYTPLEEARVPAMDRGFLLGDAVYEVIPFYHGVGFRLPQHLTRLQRSLDAVGIELDPSIDLGAVFEQLVARNPGRHQAIYLQISRGVAPQRKLRYPAELRPTVFAYSYPIQLALEGPLDQVQGIRAVTVEDQRWLRCDIKATGLLANILAIQQADAHGADEPLLVSEGRVTEGTSCNLFLVEDGAIVTPQLEPHILGGTTRGLILELAQQAGLPVKQEQVAQSRLVHADELWISSSTRGVLPVIQVNGQPVGKGVPGPLWFKVAALYQQYEQQLLG